jgi:hypothetical protein
VKNPWLKKNPLLSMWLSGANAVLGSGGVALGDGTGISNHRVTSDLPVSATHIITSGIAGTMASGGGRSQRDAETDQPDVDIAVIVWQTLYLPLVVQAFRALLRAHPARSHGRHPVRQLKLSSDARHASRSQTTARAPLSAVAE